MSTIKIKGHHEIIITNGPNQLLKELMIRLMEPDSAVFVISDENTHRYCFPVIGDILPAAAKKIVIGAGEVHKNLETCHHVWEQLLHGGADRDTLIVNLGGGMVSDLGGFAAATFKRGVRFINIPTSLLAMVDAASGGKTGIDFLKYKNMVGVFAFPEAVLIDHVFLKTLPDKEWKNGVAEIIKHGLIGNTSIWNQLRDAILNDEEGNFSGALKKNITDLLADAIRVKAEIVERDPYEKHERKFLNFGHTIGHAYESYSLGNDATPVSHGEAVAMGMVCESFLSANLCGLNLKIRDEISSVITRFFPHKLIPPGAMQQLIHLMKADKKSAAGNVAFALISEPGSPVLQTGIGTDVIHDAFHYYNSLHA